MESGGNRAIGPPYPPYECAGELRAGLALARAVSNRRSSEQEGRFSGNLGYFGFIEVSKWSLK
jgi:hypothetical protein